MSPERRAPLAALLLVACACAPSGEAPEPPSLVLITVDTLRRDHVGCYGWPRDTTPHVDALAAEGVVFERAYATMGTTLPSHLSLLTGLYPHNHGILANATAARRSFKSAPGRRLAAELLREQGFATAAFVSGAPLKRRTGVNAGFEVYDQPEARNRPGPDATDAALAWLDGAGDGPLFLWLHLWDPHEPDRPSAAELAAVGDAPGLDARLEARRIEPAKLVRLGAKILARFVDVELGERWLADDEAGRALDAAAFDAAQVRSMIDRYDAEVRRSDACVGRVVEHLRASGRLERTIVAVTADHGQALGQHDWLEHEVLTEEVIAVPWVVRFPTGSVEQPRRVERVVSGIDLMPTLLARVGGPAAVELARQADGVDALAPDFARPYVLARRAARKRKDWEPGTTQAVIGARWKLVANTTSGERLFDLERDPGELQPLEDPERQAELRDELARLATPRPDVVPTGEDGEVDQELLEELRALGYLGN